MDARVRRQIARLTSDQVRFGKRTQLEEAPWHVHSKPGGVEAALEFFDTRGCIGASNTTAWKT